MFFHAQMFLLRYLHLGIIFILLLKAGCDEIWEKICSVQGKDPSVDFTQVSKLFIMRVNKKLKLGVELLVCQDLVEDSEDDRGFDEISETAPPIELPAAELARLEVLPESS